MYIDIMVFRCVAHWLNRAARKSSTVLEGRLSNS